MAPQPDSSDGIELALADMVSSAVSDWDEVQGQTPDVLYHYTDAAGLIGVCTSGSLWATNLRFMNDAKELAHTWNLMLMVLGEIRAMATTPAQLQLIDEIERETSDRWTGYPDFYSVSFSTDGDLLSQWRGYGASGGGYAIGFEPTRLTRPESDHEQPGRFINRVIYDEATQLRLLRGVADKMMALFSGVDPAGQDLTEARARFFSGLGDVVGFVFSFKDSAWAEEQEWRAVHVLADGDLDAVHFRPHGGIAVPYVNLDIGQDGSGRLPIREIVLGPRVDDETARRSLELLLAACGYSDVTIRLSTVPLRG